MAISILKWGKCTWPRSLSSEPRFSSCDTEQWAHTARKEASPPLKNRLSFFFSLSSASFPAFLRFSFHILIMLLLPSSSIKRGKKECIMSLCHVPIFSFTHLPGSWISLSSLIILSVYFPSNQTLPPLAYRWDWSPSQVTEEWDMLSSQRFWATKGTLVREERTLKIEARLYLPASLNHPTHPIPADTLYPESR